MVAAWISADTGVGPSMASSNQDCSGTWADLPQAPRSSSRPITVAMPPGIAAAPAFTSTKAEEPKAASISMIATDMPRSPTRLTTKAFLAGDGRGRLVLPEADQQVRGQAHALPADEQHQVVVGEDQQQHRRDEQVEEPEEAAPPLVVGHVADRVDVDQAADAGDQQHEHDRQLVDQQADVDVPAAGGDPGVERHADRAGGLLAAEQLDEQRHPDHERRDRGQRCRADDPRRRRPCRPAAGPPRSPPGWRSAARRTRRVPSAATGVTTSSRFIRCPLRTSAGWRRRPRPSVGSGRW